MKRFPFHPLLIGLFSLVSVYLSNTAEASARELLLPAVIVVALAALLLGIATLAMRNVHRAAILVTAFIFFFLTYGYWVNVLWDIHPSSAQRVHYHWAVLIVQLLLLIAIGYGAAKRVKDPKSWTGNLNWLACILLACPLLMSASRFIQGGAASARAAEASVDPVRQAIRLRRPAQRPDVYFIVLDAHGRNDVLRDQYHYDDTPFLQHLQSKGFYIANQSTSNYMWTMLSIGSALNMRYLDGDLTGNESSKWRQITALLRGNLLATSLKGIGYRTVAFEAVEPWLCFDNADRYYNISNRVGISPLQQLILDTSALSQFGGERIKGRLIVDQFHLKRQMMLYKLTNLPRVAAQAGPKFVFVHIYEPHTPFVFAADGSDPIQRGYGSLLDGLNEDVTNQQYHDWYREQVIYTDDAVAGMIDNVLARSAAPPVIVLIGDHGPRSGMRANPDAAGLHECLGNLTAVFLPGKGNAGLYPGITPVNLCRVVLNDYFGAGLPLLPDNSYYSYPDAFAWTDVSAAVRPALETSQSLPAGSHGVP